MKFALIATLGLGLASAAPSALPQEKQEASLAKRQGPLALAIIGGVASAVASTVIKKFTGGSKRGTQVWTDVRGELLPALVSALEAEAQADEAVVCAREGEFAVSDWFKVMDSTTVAAHDEDGSIDLIDCFYITGPSKVTFTNGTADVGVAAGPCSYNNVSLTCS